MTQESGSLSAGERLNRLEDDMRAEETERHHGFKKVWHAIGEIRIEMAKSSIKVALLVGVCSAIGSAILSAVISVVAAKVNP